MYKNILLSIMTCGTLITATAQEHTLKLTLDQTIERARQQSPDAQTCLLYTSPSPRDTR